MAYDREFLEISWLFSIPTTEEIAVTSIKATDLTPLFDAQASLAAVDDLVMGELWNHMKVLMLSGAGFLWANYSRCFGAKVAAVGKDGHYLTDPVLFESGDPGAGTANNINPQATVCLSIRSGSALGVANFGRMYLPHSSFVQASATLPYTDSSVTGPFATKAADFINQVNDTLDNLPEGPHVRLMSNKNLGTTKTPTAVGVGRVVDTQRRRRNRLTEEYAFAAV